MLFLDIQLPLARDYVPTHVVESVHFSDKKVRLHSLIHKLMIEELKNKYKSIPLKSYIFLNLKRSWGYSRLKPIIVLNLIQIYSGFLAYLSNKFKLSQILINHFQRNKFKIQLNILC